MGFPSILLSIIQFCSSLLSLIYLLNSKSKYKIWFCIFMGRFSFHRLLILRGNILNCSLISHFLFLVIFLSLFLGFNLFHLELKISRILHDFFRKLFTALWIIAFLYSLSLSLIFKLSIFGSSYANIGNYLIFTIISSFKIYFCSWLLWIIRFCICCSKFWFSWISFFL